MLGYVIFWSVLVIALIAFIIANEVHFVSFTCVDGSIVNNPRECPQCTEDEHCNIDRVCRLRDNTCIAKECMFDEECEGEGHMCIFQRCQRV